MVANAAPTTANKVVVSEAARGQLGKILVTGKGFTLYRDAADMANKSNCTGGCASIWPPLTLPTGVKSATAAKGISGLGTIAIGHGLLQVTYHKMPLYLFASDTKPGQATGQGVGGFFVVHPVATPVS
jgi:predicted lipoprotein with Yx(FWY)xxD motif